MEILNREKKKREAEIMNACHRSAREYADKIQAAIDILMDFDEKDVDDIRDVKESYEKTGTPCILLTTPKGYQCLIDKDGNLLASNILDT